jgi:hypothetical protein
MAHALQEIAELEALVPSIIRTARFYRNAAAPLFHPFYSTITVSNSASVPRRSD